MEYEISEYSEGNKSIQDYFSGFVNIWTEYAELVYATISEEAIPTLQKVHEVSQ